MNWIRVLNILQVFRRSYFLFHNASFKLGWPDFKPKLIRSVSIRNMTSSKNYLIVGGSSGIGASIVTNLMCEHTVYSTYFKHTPVEKAENLHSAFYNVLDGEFPDFLPEVLHGIVYCPGAIDLKPFHRVSSDQLIADFQLQVVGAFKTIQAILSRLKKADAASIVLFSTVAVQTGFPFHSMVASSKGVAAASGFRCAARHHLTRPELRHQRRSHLRHHEIKIDHEDTKFTKTRRRN